MTVSDLLWHGLTTTFWVSVLTVLVLCVRRSVTQRWGARVAMLLWLIPAARLFLPTLPRVVLRSGEEAQWDAAAASGVSDPPKGPASVPPLTDQPEPKNGLDPVTEANAMDAFPTDIPAMMHDLSTASGSLPFVGAPGAELAAMFVLSVWFGGAAISLGLCWVNVRRWRLTIFAEATRSPDSLMPLVERARLRAGVNRSFHVVVSAAATTPQLLGLKRPVIALPPDFFDRLDSEEQEIALLHELVHLKRCDLIIMAVTEAAISLQWFNPLSQRVRKAVRDDQEAACDETVRSLGVCRQRYASLLVKAASRASRVPALTLEHGLKDRILLMSSPVSPRFVRRVAALTAIAGAASVAAATASYADVDIMLLADETADVDLGRGDPTATGQRRQVGLVEPKSTSAFYWDHYRSDARDNHLYTLHRDELYQTPARPPVPRSPVSALKEQWAD